jgi:ABC-type sugar transport system ATPase subunit
MDVLLEGVQVDRAGRQVLDIASLALRTDRTTAILGPNGSGKTTLLRVIAGLERPRTGRVLVGGAPARAGQPLAYVFQDDVFLRRTVRANLELGLQLRGIAVAERRERIDSALALFGIAHLGERRADRLSGGEGRRVSLARALCLHAPLVLLDEPLAELDLRTYSRLLDELPLLLARFAATTIVVTHSPEEALLLAEDLVVLVDGRVHASGPKQQIAGNPRLVEVAHALGYTVVSAGGRRVAVPPAAWRLGGGDVEFELVVDRVADMVDAAQVIGRINDMTVRIAVSSSSAVPGIGDRVVASASRVYDLQ